MSQPNHEISDEALNAVIERETKIERHEAWWYKRGAYIATAAIAAAVWAVMIAPKEVTPRSEMVLPATAVLEKGIKNNKDVKTLSRELKISARVPDFRQLGGKLTKSSSADFGGEKAVLMQFQYGKSVFLLYRFERPSKLFRDMKQVQTKAFLYYITSGGAVSVVAWKDKKEGYYAVAAKATENDLLLLAEKMSASV